MATVEWVPGFLAKHDVVVELRQTFLTPAPANLSTKAVLQSSDGLGKFTFEGVPYGTYILYIKRPGYLTRALQVTISASDPQIVTLVPPGTADGGVFNLWWGDVDGDLRVDNSDALVIMTLMSNGVSAYHYLYSAAADLDADGRPDNSDILLVINMWGKTVRNYPGAQYIDFYI
jgi:hypothetical protein